MADRAYNDGVKRRSPSSDPEIQRRRKTETTERWKARNPEKVRAWAKERAVKNRDRINETTRKYRRANRAHFAALQREWVAKNPEKAATQKRAAHFKRTYGMTITDYDTMYAAQGGCCAICSAHEDGYSLHVDHDHATGKIRALLCTGCNKGIGFLGEDQARMMRAIQYLARFRQPEVQANG